MRVLVTGGNGFLGGAVVRQLLARGDSVRSVSRTHSASLEALGVEQFRADLADPADAAELRRALAGCDAAVHVAAKAGVWGRERDYFAANVLATRALVAAMRSEGVPRLVHTSTPSVVHTGRDLVNAAELTPLATHFDAAYPRTKAIAEREVLAANSPELATVALRPHLIYGPGDPHLLPRFIARAKSGRLRRIGARPIMVDVTHVENAARAHLLAIDGLRPAAACAGRAYFVADGAPVELWAFLNRALELAGLPPVTRSLPVPLARLVADMGELAWAGLRLPGEPPLTRFVVSQLSTSHHFDLTAIRRDLGYEPLIDTDAGLEALGPELQALAQRR